MKRLLAVASVAVALAAGSASVSPASAAVPVHALKPCSSGYVHAVLSWGHKCLRAGQFCKVGNPEYVKYGFSCPSDGHLRRR